MLLFVCSLVGSCVFVHLVALSLFRSYVDYGLFCFVLVFLVVRVLCSNKHSVGRVCLVLL